MNTISKDQRTHSMQNISLIIIPTQKKTTTTTTTHEPIKLKHARQKLLFTLNTFQQHSPAFPSLSLSLRVCLKSQRQRRYSRHPTCTREREREAYLPIMDHMLNNKTCWESNVSAFHSQYMQCERVPFSLPLHTCKLAAFICTPLHMRER